MWRLFWEAATPAQIARMVLFCTMRCPFITHSRSEAVAVKMHGRRASMSALIRSMRVAIFLATLLAASSSAIADATSITSPDHAQTFAFGEMILHQLYLDRTAGELAARITFSNLPYYDDDQPRRDESFDFRFPNVQFDSAQRTFFARHGHGERIPVARFREGIACGWIDLAPGAKIYLLKEHGRVTAILTATNHPRVGTRWVQMDNNFSLQNILVALFGDFRTQSDD